MKFKFERNRLYLENDSDRDIAEVEFSQDEDGVYEITRTFVDDALRGKGIAGNMMKLLAEEVRKRGAMLRPVCSYAVHFFEKHAEEYKDVVAVD